MEENGRSKLSRKKRKQGIVLASAAAFLLSQGFMPTVQAKQKGLVKCTVTTMEGCGDASCAKPTKRTSVMTVEECKKAGGKASKID